MSQIEANIIEGLKVTMKKDLSENPNIEKYPHCISGLLCLLETKVALGSTGL